MSRGRAESILLCLPAWLTGPGHRGLPGQDIVPATGTGPCDNCVGIQSVSWGLRRRADARGLLHSRRGSDGWDCNEHSSSSTQEIATFYPRYQMQKIGPITTMRNQQKAEMKLLHNQRRQEDAANPSLAQPPPSSNCPAAEALPEMQGREKWGLGETG
jgi:hypothetical protein